MATALETDTRAVRTPSDVHPGPGRLPDFIAVGPPRTATTWLDQVLRGHVGLPLDRKALHRKETDFFKRNYGRGLDWYKAYFRNCPAELPVGEICPTYFALAESRERIAKDIPGCRIIVTLRDPVGRAYSYYRLMRRMGWEKADFERAIERRRDIADTNRYAFHLKAWRESFGAGNVLVCLYDDLRVSAQAYIDRVCDFVGAPRFTLGESAFINDEVNGVARAPKSRHLAQNARNVRIWLDDHDWHRTMSLLERAGVWRLCFGRGEPFLPIDPVLDAKLRERFRPEVEALEDLIGRDLSAWKTPRAKS